MVVLIALLAGCSAMFNTGILDMGEIQVGIASWYGRERHGCTTTDGQEYNMNMLTAAHRTLPFGTVVRVTNVKNGESVIVKINDRGPWKPGRVVDLSYAAAKKIKMVQDGITRVKLEILNDQISVASWYGKRAHGQHTASGEICDMDQLTAAHSELPFGSIVRVINIDNGKDVTVRINDRIPEKSVSQEVVINLSKRAAEKLGMLKSGKARVMVDVIKPAYAR